MYKLFLAAYLLLISVLPSTDNKVALENRVKGLIDAPASEKEVGPNDKTYQTAEIVDGFREKAVSARAAYFIDLGSGQVLLEKNAEDKLPIASLTKLMTAIITVESAESDEIVTVPALKTRPDDALMNLVPGDRLTVEELLQGLLIPSGSDAALTLASYVGGSEPEFVATMNERATTLGLSDTQFTNSVGWDEAGNYSSAHDLVILSKVALSNPRIREIVAKKTSLVKSETGRSYLLTNSNLLLDNKRYFGTKTGYTYDAGKCLAIYYKDDEKEIAGVILDSPNRFPETNNIVEWINRNFIFK